MTVSRLVKPHWIAILALGIPDPTAARAWPVPSGACEIHVWPSARLNSLTEGAIWNNVIDSAITPHGPRVTERAVPRSALDPEEQRQHLKTINFAVLLKTPEAVVTIHAEESKRRANMPVGGRQTISTAACYVELTIAKNFFSRSPMAGRMLRSLVILDNFGSQQLPERSFVAWADTRLHIFPAKRPKDEPAAAAELAAAFKANLNKFIGYALAPPRKT